MTIEIEEIKKLKVKPDEVLFIKVKKLEISDQDQRALVEGLRRLEIKAIIHYFDMELSAVKQNIKS